MNLQVFDSPDKTFQLADFSGRGRGLKFSTNEHGFAECSLFVPMSQKAAFAIYDWPGMPHLEMRDQVGIVYTGRLEDIAIVDGGVQLGAMGYWRALNDVPYTALWSATDMAEWRPLNQDDYANAHPQRYEMDNNNRLYIAIRKGEESSNYLHGAMGYIAPDNGERQIAAVTFDYELVGASGYTASLSLRDASWVFISEKWTITTDGTTQTGTQSLTFSGCDSLIFRLYSSGGTAIEFTGETGDTYLKITNLRVKSTTAINVLASDIIAALAAYVNGINGVQLSASSALIEATSTDLRDEKYEDQYPAEILDRLALLHNYEVGVWACRRLHFRPKGSAGRHWHINVTRILELQRSLENMRNSIYATYKKAGGRVLRSADADDGNSQSRRAIVRRGLVNVNTTDQTEAETHRDAFLSDRKDFVVRSSVEFDRLIDPTSQAAFPLWHLRAGDTITMQNLPVGVSAEIEHIRTFLVGRTVYDVDGRQISLESESPTPTLVTLIAQKELSK